VASNSKSDAKRGKAAVLVLDCLADSPARKAQIFPGMLINKINNKSGWPD
jgi:C-terminal processing protease CtpA/Prc